MLKRIIGQILTLGAYDDWNKLPKWDKIMLPLAYLCLIAGFYFLGRMIK